MFENLKRLFSEAGGEINQLRRTLDIARQQRDLTASAPMSKADAIAALHGLIDARGAAHGKTFQAALTTAVRSKEPARLDTRVVALARPDFMPTPSTMEDALCLWLGAQIKETVRLNIEAMPWPPGSMSHAEKIERLGEIDVRIAQLEKEMAVAARDARAAGLNP